MGRGGGCCAAALCGVMPGVDPRAGRLVTHDASTLCQVKPVEVKAKPVGDKARVSDVDDVRKEVTNWVLQMAADSSVIY